MSLFKDETASHLTHEFKTPLNAIQSAKLILAEEMAKPEPDQKKIADYMAMIERNTARLEEFVHEILSFSKAGPEQAYERQSIELSEVLNNVLERMPGLEARLTVRKDGDLSVYASREGITQVLTNVIANAVKFCPEGPIELDMRGEAHSVEISVRDYGQGIAPADLENIFKPFVKTQSGNIKGSGLGLSIVKRWVDLHGGTVWAESAGIGKGAVIYVRIPK